eukprot:scaffold2194_cov105-Skeletonema_marinoi.AAC.4
MNHEQRITCCEIACAIGSDVAEPTYAVKLVAKRVLRNGSNATAAVVCNMVAASDACDYIVQGPCT